MQSERSLLWYMWASRRTRRLAHAHFDDTYQHLNKSWILFEAKSCDVAIILAANWTTRNKQSNKIMAVSANRPFRLGRTSMVGSTALIILQLQWQLAIVVADPTGTQCSQPEGRSDTCVCQTSDGVVDLTGLANYDGESARYHFKLIDYWLGSHRMHKYDSKLVFHCSCWY